MSITTNPSTLSATIALYDVLHAAIERGAPLSVLYATDGKVTKERVLHPLEIVVGKCGSDIVWAHDSIRDGILSFRLDRFVAWDADDEPHQDWEDSPQGRAIAGR
jgi:predicted DNA-binding transcriptional regulator YafY